MHDHVDSQKIPSPAPPSEGGAKNGSKTSRRRFLRFAIRWSIGAVVIWLSVSFVVAYKLTRRPRPFHDEPIPTSLTNVESLRLTTSDGQELGAWFIPGKPDKPIVLALHGNGGSRSSEANRQTFLIEAGYPLLLVSQRSHGDSTGDSNDFGLSNRFDVIAAVDWIRQNQPQLKIVIWGHSLGSASALFAAEQLGDSVAGYILESPFRDLLTATRNRTRMSLPPVLDQIAYAGLRTAAVVVLPKASQISPLDAASRMPASATVLILAGDRDQHATMPEAEAIHERIGVRSRLVVIAGASHGQLQATDPKFFQRSMIDFLESVK